MFKAKWSGSYPCLCCGCWKITKNGLNVSDAIPEKKRKKPMNTFGIYSMWSFNDDYEEEWEEYKDGLKCDEWIAENKWIEPICDNYNEMQELFKAIQEEDWRSSSCGGCI